MRSLPQPRTLIKVTQLALEEKPIHGLLSECDGLYSNAKAETHLVRQIHEFDRWFFEHFEHAEWLFSEEEADRVLDDLMCRFELHEESESDECSIENEITRSRAITIFLAYIAGLPEESNILSPLIMNLLRAASDAHEVLVEQHGRLEC
ncbi:hypothetical protein [Aporhodopirellula aestuarii]|uniref:Uncharacterized protein n=1 Tax=Aporhodopirellula aestuarii TaxID=2950107 RepID=A0ABT0U0I8_9BACT|nr:hypothetical protein [Aporhodopirellula aestuarii]MCM2370384.1 hypothetical protein [Aporhodopirellula aestuarii]